MATTKTGCECGQITGERCGAKPPRGQRYTRIEWVPPYQRGTAEKLVTWAGVSETLRVHPDCVDMLTHIEIESGRRIVDPWVRVL